MKKKEYLALITNENYHWWLKAKRLYVTALLQEIFPDRSKRLLLDIGCGTGKNFEVYKKFANITAIDASPYALRYARHYKYAKVLEASAENLPFHSRSFDIVTLVDVLYHNSIQHDTQVLDEIYRVLKPHGYLLLIDCANPGLFGPHDVNNYARERYTKTTLITKLTTAHFHIVRSTHLYFFVYPLFVIQRLLEKYGILKEDTSFDHSPFFINTILYTLCRIENVLLSRADFPWGSSLAFLCKK
jgi:ubiquinone/menaquinone biosynthesis C-methylase UbiE